MRDGSKPKQKNVQKRPAKPKAAVDHPENNHPMGLWVNTEFFRGLSRREPRTIPPSDSSQPHNRYLHLADVALSEPKHKKKNDKRKLA
jgi:hypothetical protein